MTPVRNTPLEVEFELNPHAGIQYMKERVKAISETVEAKNALADQMEKETALLKEEHRKIMMRHNKIRRVTYEGEERLGVVERNIRELEKRLYDKEIFLREIKAFNYGDSIEEAARVDRVLIEKKQLYKENYIKFQKSRQYKIVLEQRLDTMESRTRAINSKINALTCQLHHMNVEQGRKTEEIKRCLENAALNLKKIEKLEADTKAMRKRMVSGSQKVELLTNLISNKETEIQSMRSNRMAIEKTIKNMKDTLE